MVIILDTNVLSELMRAAPASPVIAWVSEQRPAALTTTSITVAEVRYGIARLPQGRRREGLESAATDVFAAFHDEVLPFDSEAATRYPGVVLRRQRSGAPISGFDAQIAAICLTYDAALATRNTRDFEGLGLRVMNPWAENR